MHERQWHEFSEAARPFLQVSNPHEVPSPVFWLFYVSVHDCRGGAETHLMCCLHDLQPLVGVDLVRTDDRPNLVVENFGSCTGQRAQTNVLQFPQIVRQVQI